MNTRVKLERSAKNSICFALLHIFFFGSSVFWGLLSPDFHALALHLQLKGAPLGLLRIQTQKMPTLWANLHLYCALFSFFFFKRLGDSSERSALADSAPLLHTGAGGGSHQSSRLLIRRWNQSRTHSHTEVILITSSFPRYHIKMAARCRRNNSRAK